VAQRRIVAPILSGRGPARPPLPLLLLARSARLRRIPARMIGLGLRPEHVRTPEVKPGG